MVQKSRMRVVSCGARPRLEQQVMALVVLVNIAACLGYATAGERARDTAAL